MAGAGARSRWGPGEGGPKEGGAGGDKKRFIIGAPANYDKMKGIRSRNKEAAKMPKVNQPPNPASFIFWGREFKFDRCV